MSDNNGEPKLKFSRRDFLKLAGTATGAVVIELTRRKLPDISKWWDENGAMLTGKVEDLDLITSEVPKSLEGKDIPTKNEQFRNADVVFQEGLVQYEDWQSKNPKLAKPQYKKPENYLSIESMAVRLEEKVRKAPEKLDEGYLGYVDYLLDAADDFDIPYSMLFEGSGTGISSVQQMIAIDPGTGFVREIRSSMKEQFGKEFDVWSACEYNRLTNKQHAFISNAFHDWYYDAMEYVYWEKKRPEESISTSVLFAYFLRKNNGDILESVWDTSVWLKILVRNDPNNDLKYDPSYDRAEMATDFFKDEFSPTISANWVVKNVDINDKLLNDIESPYAHSEYKDYMPPNRAGGYYHAWNIMALSMSMSPFLAKRMIATQTNPSLGDDGKRWTEYGRVKCTADMLVVDKADEIARITNSYSY